MGMLIDGTSRLDADQLNQKVQAGGDVRKTRLCVATIYLRGALTPTMVSNYGFDGTSLSETPNGMFNIDFLEDFSDWPGVTFGIRPASGSTALGYSVEQIVTTTDALKQAVSFHVMNASGVHVDDPDCVVSVMAFGPVS